MRKSKLEIQTGTSKDREFAPLQMWHISVGVRVDPVHEFHFWHEHGFFNLQSQRVK